MDYPKLYIKMRRNTLGQVGPVLCWPDGSALKSQKSIDYHFDADRVPTITVEFIIDGETIEAPPGADINNPVVEE